MLPIWRPSTGSAGTSDSGTAGAHPNVGPAGDSTWISKSPLALTRSWWSSACLKSVAMWDIVV